MIWDYLDHCASKEPVNPLWARIHRFVDAQWSEWSRINDPISDHPKGIHPKALIFPLYFHCPRYLHRFDQELQQISEQNSIKGRQGRAHASREDTINIIIERERELYNTCGIGRLAVTPSNKCSLKEQRHNSCILKKIASFYQNRHFQSVSILFMESLLWCFSSLPNYCF